MLLSACSESVQPLSEVSGNVSLNGQTISDGSVVFLSESGNGGSAEISQSGNYHLQCPPGQYHVAISPRGLPDPFAPTPPPALPAGGTSSNKVPREFTDLSESGLIVDVGPGSTTFDIQMDGKKSK